MTYKGSSRCFNHNTKLCFFRIFNAVFFQLSFYAFTYSNDFFKLPYICYHRKHYSEIAECRRSEQSTKLCSENFRTIKTKSYCTDSESRVFFLWHIKIIALLICTYIKSTDYNFFARHAFKNTFIYFKLLIFGRIIGVFKIKKLASEKSDTARVVKQNSTDIVCTADICIDIYFSSVKSNVFLALELLEKFFFLLFLSTFHFGGFNSFCVRVKYKFPCKSVCDSYAAVLYSRQKFLAYTDNCRNIHITGKNCRM